MTIKKYLHSCVVLEEAGKRLLFDPGSFSFMEDGIKPEDIGPVDVVVLTHKHGDHYYPEALKRLYALNPFTLIASQEIASAIEVDGLQVPVTVASVGDELSVADFRITALMAEHELIPAALPHNMAYVVNDLVMHPGDSYAAPEVSGLEVLLLPVAGPWSTWINSIEFASRLKPKQVVPIHDAVVKDFMVTRTTEIVGGRLKELDIVYVPLALGEQLDI